MALQNPQIHVVVGDFAAGNLQELLDTLGSTADIFPIYDDFSFGPIKADDAVTRADWVRREFGHSDWQETLEDTLPVVSASKNAELPPIVWLSSDRASSTAGFLWWLSHMGDRECLVVDVPGADILYSADMGKYFDRAAPLSATRRSSYLDLWAKLQLEDAPLRVLESGTLTSASIEYFDASLLSYLTPDWQKMSRIVGGVLFDFIEAGVYQTGDFVLFARLVKLAQAGKLEWRGDLNQIANCQMRLLA